MLIGLDQGRAGSTGGPLRNQAHVIQGPFPYAIPSSVIDTDPDGIRRLTAGLLTALFRAELQGEKAAPDYLVDPSATPVTIEVESR